MKTTDLLVTGSFISRLRSGTANLFLAVFLFVLVLFVSGCDILNLLDPEDSAESEGVQSDAVPVAFTGIDVEEAATTTQLSLNFSSDISELTTDDITIITEPGGIAVSGLIKTNQPGVYTLVLAGVNAPGEIVVTVNKGGYRIEPASRAAPVYYASTVVPAMFTSLTADGTESTASTTELTLVFDKEISGLAVNDITITTADAVKGELVHTPGTPVYTLGLSDVTAPGEITVIVSRNSYKIEPMSRTVQASYVPLTTQAAFLYLAANGVANMTATTQLTFVFDKPVAGLTEDDITVTGLVGLTKGTLSLSGTTYTLPISGFTEAGLVMVAISKSGCAITPASKTVPVHYVPPTTQAAFLHLAANGAENTVTTTELTLVFDTPVSGLTEDDITVSGLTGLTKGVLGLSGTTCTLSVSGFTAAGTVTVTVNKSGCTITPASRTVQVHYVPPTTQAAFLHLTADGTANTATTTQLTLVFDKSVSGLTENDITVSGLFGLAKGALNQSGTTYTLPISGFTTAGTVTVAVNKSGCVITPTSHTVPVHYVPPTTQAAFLYLTANGTANATSTTELTLVFDKPVAGLTESDISVTGLSGLTKGVLSQSGTTTYILPVSGFTATGTATVTVNKSGYGFNPASQMVQVHYVPPVIQAEFLYLTANGTANMASTTHLTLTFNQSVAGLTANDITVTGLSGLAKGTFAQSGTTTYLLSVSGFTAAGSVTVEVNKSGYHFSPAAQMVQVYYVPPTVQAEFLSLTADGTANTATTTQLTLTFDKSVSGLTENDITVSGLTGLTKGPLSQNGTTYTLPVSGFTEGGSVTVTVNKSGYGFSPATRIVQVYYVTPSTQTEFLYLAANGTANTATTTQLTLTFDKSVSGLTENDITVGGLSGLTKGTLSQSGTTTYILPISGFTMPGTVTVTVSKSGYGFNPATRIVQAHYVTPVVFTDLTANGTANTVTTTQLTLAFDRSVSGLTENDITITGLYGLTKGTLSQSGTTYTLPISGFTAGGSVTVTVTKSGYNFSPAKIVQVHYVASVMFTNLTANGAANTTSTTWLALAFDQSVSGLTEDDITVTGLAGLTKGTLSLSGTTYTLPISGFTAAGTATVTVSKSGFHFNPVSKTVQVYFSTAEASGSIKAAFDISSMGTTGVVATFTALHDFIQNGGLVSEPDKIKLGDWIDLEGGLTVAAYAGEGGFSATNNAITASDLPFPGYVGKSLRLIVVGINSFRTKNGYTYPWTSPDHVVFQFQNLPTKHRMNPTNTNQGGYTASEMRKYLVAVGNQGGNFLTGLIAAGVPQSVLWAPARRVANGGYGSSGTTTINDLLWLPTEREMVGESSVLANSVASTYETAGNQARLEYYGDESQRRKFYDNSLQALHWYWLSSPNRSDGDLFCGIGHPGINGNAEANVAGGVAPAFCVR
jgi:hypothetical protein